MKNKIYNQELAEQELENFPYKNKRETEKEVKIMLDNWDKVKCGICKKKISMLEARLSKDGSRFICRKGH